MNSKGAQFSAQLHLPASKFTQQWCSGRDLKVRCSGSPQLSSRLGTYRKTLGGHGNLAVRGAITYPTSLLVPLPSLSAVMGFFL